MEQAAGPAVAFNGTTLAAFVGYLALVLGIGAYATRFSSAGIAEFFVGGRRMNRFVVALSAVVSGRSAWLILGVSGMAYSRGASALWAVVGYTVVELLLFLFYAPRLRRLAERYDCITVTDFFAARFSDEDNRLRATLTAIIAVFMVGYVAAQFVAGGKAFSASFGVSPAAGILVTAAIVLAYTTLGGFLAVSLTDVLQALFMLFALVALPAVAIANAGGAGPVLDQLKEFDPAFVDPFALSVGALIGFVGIGLGSPGNPHILVRYMSVADPAQLRTSAWIATAWNATMSAGAVLIGLVGRIYYPTVERLPAADTENLYPMLAQQQLHPVIFGMVVASIFAAIMSTADSQLLVAASALVRDLYQRIIKREQSIPAKKLVLLSRVALVLLVVAAVVFGFLARNIVFWLVLFAWAGLGAAFGPTSILALFWRRTTRAGVFAGMLTGAGTTIAWYYTPVLKAAMYELVPGFAAGLIATVLVSLATRPPEDADAAFAAMTTQHSLR